MTDATDSLTYDPLQYPSDILCNCWKANNSVILFPHKLELWVVIGFHHQIT